MDLRRQLWVIRRWWALIVVAVVVAGVGTYLVSSSLPKVYQGRATLIVGQSLNATDPNYNQILASQRLSQTYAQLASTTPVLQRVIDRLELDLTTLELRRSLIAQAPRESTLVHVTASHTDPAMAAAIANEVAQQLIGASPAVHGRGEDVGHFISEQLEATQRQVETAQVELERLQAVGGRTAEQDRQIELLESRLTTLRQTYAQLLAFSNDTGANLVTLVDPAMPPEEPASPRVLLYTLIVALLALMAAVGLAFLIEILDDSVKSPDDVQEVAGLPTLGLIVRIKGAKGKASREVLATRTAPRSSAAEAFRTLRTNLEFASLDSPLRTLLVTSAVPGEGKSTIAANIAITFAQAGKRVILLDGDMRRPRLHWLFEVPNSSGLTTLLRADDSSLELAAQASDEPNLRVITTGSLPPNPAELLGSQRMRAVLARLRDDADLIVIDSPPLQAVTDAAVLAPDVDGVLLVTEAGRTKRAALAQAREALARVNAHVLGVSLNGLTERTGGGYYRYHGEYYGASTDAAERGASHSAL